MPNPVTSQSFPGSSNWKKPEAAAITRFTPSPGFNSLGSLQFTQGSFELLSTATGVLGETD